ncbi:phosphonate C-P lyase system protein PhnH [Palleronia sp.]|uniref:phosphonate C-P lyase system protein PhnH n=1 Tax=Palleronia sp. TaxID=1940284 RepID=UPI0035C87710
MFADPTPDADEQRDNATFAAVLGALARPGTEQTLPEPDLLTVARALIDRECRAAADDEEMRSALGALGATVVLPELADHAVLAAGDAEFLARLPVGDALYPERGATAIVSARIGEGARLRLTGPGIEVAEEMAIAVDAAFWAARKAACRYPLGIDLIFVDGARTVAVPRSTNVEVI